MIKLTFSQLATIVDGRLVGSDASFDSVFTDSRKPLASGLFIALKGDNFDGHHYVDSLSGQAAAALVSSEQETMLPQVVVTDTRVALGKLGAWLCAQVAPYRIAITGSVGKTSVKEMTASVFALAGNTLATAGNFNNDLGVPLTLLRLEPEHEYGVFELGANHIGEIDYTSNLVKPNVAMINNIQAAHLEGFGSIEGVLNAKTEIFNHLVDSGHAVVNLDDHKAGAIIERLANHQVITFSSRQRADLMATNIGPVCHGCYQFSLNRGSKSVDVTLPVIGRHQVDNALAAAALATAAGLSLELIAKGLERMQPVKGRMRPVTLTPSLTILDDSYNASIAATEAALDALAECEGITALAFGDMGELGEDAEQLHRQVGEYATKKGIDQVFCVGTLSRSVAEVHPSARHFDSQSELHQAIIEWLHGQQQPVTLLVKGSRSAAMERVIDALGTHFGEQN